MIAQYRGMGTSIRTSLLALMGLLMAVTPALATAPKKKSTAQPVESCMAGGSKESKFRLGSSGFDEEDMSIVEGVAGPELRIGDIHIFLDPNSNADASDTKNTSLNNTWCMVNPALAKKRGQTDLKKPICDVPRAPSGDDKKGEPVDILGQKGEVIGKLHAKIEKGPDGKERQRLILVPSRVSSRDVHNQIHLTGEAVKTGNKITTKLRIESRNKDNDAVNGVAESSMSGYLDDKANANDPMAEVRMKGCISDNQAKGQLRNKDEDADNWVDLSGSHIVMRGKETPGVDQYKKKEDKTPQFMTDNAGRAGTR